MSGYWHPRIIMIIIIIKFFIKFYSILILSAFNPVLGMLWFLFLYLRRMTRFKYYSTGIVHLLFAPVGAGKSAYIAWVVKRELRRIDKNKSPFVNIVSDSRIKGVEFCEDLRGALKRGMFKRCLLIFEEAGLSYSNVGPRLTDRERREKKLIRHYRCSAIYISQSHEDIDVVIRRLYNKIDIIKSLGNLSYLKPIWRKIDINEEKKIDDSYHFYPAILYATFYFKPLYYHLFDSYWVPDDIPIIDLKNKMIIADGVEIPFDDRFIESIESADGMTFKEKLLCNNNINQLVKTGLYTIKKGQIVKTDIYNKILGSKVPPEVVDRVE